MPIAAMASVRTSRERWMSRSVARASSPMLMEDLRGMSVSVQSADTEDLHGIKQRHHVCRVRVGHGLIGRLLPLLCLKEATGIVTHVKVIVDLTPEFHCVIDICSLRV